jgi:hypothetical protein
MKSRRPVNSDVRWLLVMRRTLSSDLTGIFKFFPAFWIPFFGLGTAGLFLGVFRGANDSPAPDFLKWLFFCLWIAGSFFSYITCAALKQVAADEHFLYVSNFINEISIPMADVCDVTENYWLNIHPVTVHLKRTSRFGSKITFMPKIKFFGACPAVTELKSLAKIEEMRVNQ